MPRTVIFHPDGSLLVDKHEVVHPVLWNTDAYVWFDGMGFKPGWYVAPLGARRSNATQKVKALDPNEVPNEIRLKLLLIL